MLGPELGRWRISDLTSLICQLGDRRSKVAKPPEAGEINPQASRPKARKSKHFLNSRGEYTLRENPRLKPKPKTSCFDCRAEESDLPKKLCHGGRAIMLIRILRRRGGGSCPGLYRVAVSMPRGFRTRLAKAAQHTVVVQMACSRMLG